MRERRITRLGVAVLTTVMTVTVVQAQEDKIEDQDLLNLLSRVEATNTNAPKTSGSFTAPIDLAEESVDAADERAVAADEVMATDQMSVEEAAPAATTESRRLCTLQSC